MREKDHQNDATYSAAHSGDKPALDQKLLPKSASFNTADNAADDGGDVDSLGVAVAIAIAPTAPACWTSGLNASRTGNSLVRNPGVWSIRQ